MLKIRMWPSEAKAQAEFFEDVHITHGVDAHLAMAYCVIFKCLGDFERSFIAGGAIASLVLDEMPHDYDVWFRSQACLDTALAKARTAADQRADCAILAETDHAMTLRLTGKPFLDGIIVQLVKTRIGQPSDVVNTFDFKHTRSFYVPDEGVNMEAAGGIAFIKSKQLVYDHETSPYMLSTMQRLVKFAARGYIVPALTLARLMHACHGLKTAELPSLSPDTVLRQAIGSKGSR